MNSEDTEAGRDKLREKMKERVKEKEAKKGRTEGGKKDEVDNLTDMMKDLKIFQLEKKLEEQLAEISANKGEQTQQSSLRPEALPYLTRNQYGKRQWLPRPSQRQQAPAPSTIRGCYYDGGSHYRENCEELKRALECREVHRKGQGQALYLGREDSGTTIRVPFPEEKDGRVVWQKEWVENELRKKESEVKVNVIVLEKSREGELKKGERGEDQIEYMNGQPVVVTRVKVEEEEEYEAVIEEKRVRGRDDEGENKRKKKIAVEIPARSKVLGRGEPMDVDNDEDMGARGQEKKEKGKEVEKRTSAKTKAQKHLWEKIREEADINKISEKILETAVPNLTLKEVLSISPDLITEWFGVKRVPSVPLKEKDLKEVFEVCVTRWGKGAHKPLYGCASPKCKGKVEGYQHD